MNNIGHLNTLDPIFNEYEAFVDKDAGLKTIAFKYFGADIQKALVYLDLNNVNESSKDEDFALSLVENKSTINLNYCTSTGLFF